MTSQINYRATESVPGTDITFRRTGEGDRSILFVHGFLDSYAIWDDVLASLATSGVEIAALDLAGMGDRTDVVGPLTFERYADEVGKVVDLLAKPTVIVAHSMGTQIAELVAAQRPEQVIGLVLIAPVPLAGTHFPAEALAPFSQVAGSVEGMRTLRAAASAGSRVDGVDRLAEVGAKVRPDVVKELAQLWNNGYADAGESSGYKGPVLLLAGAQDTVASPESVTGQTAPRFASARYFAVDNAGHWPHFEQVQVVAGQLDEFLTDVVLP
jgi:pimeloyl-ACP methyl ester carboxylesterase